MKNLLFLFVLCFISVSGYSQCLIKADFEISSTDGCGVPYAVFFTDKSTIPDTWSWNFGDGSTSKSKNPIHSYTSAGEFTVILFVLDTMTGCSSTITKKIIIYAPVANFDATPKFGCAPLSVNFTNNSSQDESWLWNFGDGTTSEEEKPSHIYEKSGVYDVSLTVTSKNGCTSTKTSKNFVQVFGPDVDFSVNKTEGCEASSFNFTDATTYGSPIISWKWNFGDGLNSSSQSPSHNYTASGKKSVSLTVNDLDGCSRTLTKDDLISINPAFEIDKSATICSGDNYTFPDGTKQNNIKKQVVHVSSLSTKNGCDSIITTTIKVNPTYNLTITDSVCYGESYTYPDGTTENNIITKTLHTSELITKMGCDSTVVTTIKVTEIDNSVSVSGVILSATMEEAEYKWINCNDNNAIIDTETESSYSTSGSGDYAVEITYKNCKDTSDCASVIGLGLIENEFGNALSVYPNPSNGNITAQLSNGSTIKEAKLYDLTGQELQVKKQLSGNQATIEITEPTGYYLLEITSTENKRARIKILKN